MNKTDESERKRRKKGDGDSSLVTAETITFSKQAGILRDSRTRIHSKIHEHPCVRRIRRTGRIVDPSKLAPVSSKTGNRFSRAAFDSNYHETAALTIAEERGGREEREGESNKEVDRDGRRTKG